MAKIREKAPRYRPEVEGLESRLVPAGNVIAQVVGSDIVIRGDGAANGVFISGTPSQFGGQVSVVGFTLDGIPTTINGKPPVNGFSSELLLGGANNLNIFLGGGDDSLLLSNLFVVDTTVRIFGEGGNDIIALTNSTFISQFSFTVFSAPQLVVDAGAGNDVLNFQDTFFQGPVTVLLGAGNDIAFMRRCTFANSLILNGGPGFDLLLDFGGNFASRAAVAADFAFVSPFVGVVFNPFFG